MRPRRSPAIQPASNGLLYAPAEFYAVGQFFEDFSEVTDEMVVTALSRAVRAA
jgi:predicted phosphoribosyltransferase